MKILCVVVYLFVFASFSLDASSLASFSCPHNQVIKQGLNEKFKTSPHSKRTFYAEFPDVPRDTEMGVVFSWHGAGDSIENWRSKFPLSQESTRQFPFIVITPHDLGLTPHGDKKGFAWDLFTVQGKDKNVEALLFENVLGCLAKTHNISPNRIYMAGFSAGAMVANMLHSLYPDVVAAVYSASGAWWNDPFQRSLFRLPFGIRIPMNWPELEPQNSGAVFLTVGGDDDVFSIFGKVVLSFKRAAEASKEFLFSHNRTVVICEHDLGHHPHPAVHTRHVVHFFKLNQAHSKSRTTQIEDLLPSLRHSCEVISPL